MSEQQITVGRIVHYSLNDADVVAIEARKAETGAKTNPLGAGTLVAAMCVANWGGSAANLRLLLDGHAAADLWVTSRPYADGPLPGHWHWPARV